MVAALGRRPRRGFARGALDVLRRRRDDAQDVRVRVPERLARCGRGERRRGVRAQLEVPRVAHEHQAHAERGGAPRVEALRLFGARVLKNLFQRETRVPLRLGVSGGEARHQRLRDVSQTRRDASPRPSQVSGGEDVPERARGVGANLVALLRRRVNASLRQKTQRRVRGRTLFRIVFVFVSVTLSVRVSARLSGPGGGGARGKRAAHVRHRPRRR